MGGIAGSSGKNRYFEIPDPESNSGAGDAGRSLRMGTRASGCHEMWGNKLPAGISTNLPYQVRNSLRADGITVYDGSIWFDNTGNTTCEFDNNHIWFKINGVDVMRLDADGTLSVKLVVHSGPDVFPSR